jgi:hypothetical protein
VGTVGVALSSDRPQYRGLNHGGVRQVIFFTQPGLISDEAQTGSMLWRYPFPYSASSEASPVVGSALERYFIVLEQE